MNRFPRTHLFIDQYSGRVLGVHDPKVDGFGDTVLNWLVPLHDGKAFGMIGRVVVMLLGLMPSRHVGDRLHALEPEAQGPRRRQPRARSADMGTVCRAGTSSSDWNGDDRGGRSWSGAFAHGKGLMSGNDRVATIA